MYVDEMRDDRVLEVGGFGVEDVGDGEGSGEREWDGGVLGRDKGDDERGVRMGRRKVKRAGMEEEVVLGWMGGGREEGRVGGGEEVGGGGGREEERGGGEGCGVEGVRGEKGERESGGGKREEEE